MSTNPMPDHFLQRACRSSVGFLLSWLLSAVVDQYPGGMVWAKVSIRARAIRQQKGASPMVLVMVEG